MIPPLQRERAQLHQWEMRQEADLRRLVRQMGRATARPACGVPWRTIVVFRTLWWLTHRMSGASYAHRT